MRTKNILLAGMALVLALFFASCSTSVDIAKRHHSNGYYIHFASKKNVSSNPVETVVASKEVKSVSATEVIEPVTETAIIADEKPATEAQTIASVTKRPTVASVKKRLKDAMAEMEQVSSENNVVAERTKFNYAQKRFSRSEFPKVVSRDTPGIVMILLCIFIPFVAVGIEDDWGTRFWIDLLLCFLFWIPGVIYAFIVCFG